MHLCTYMQPLRITSQTQNHPSASQESLGVVPFRRMQGFRSQRSNPFWLMQHNRPLCIDILLQDAGNDLVTQLPIIAQTPRPDGTVKP